jgi:hypothetical protein
VIIYNSGIDDSIFKLLKNLLTINDVNSIKLIFNMLNIEDIVV